MSEHKPTQKLNRETLAQTPRVSLHKDIVRFATGNESIHWVVDYTRNGVGVLPLLNSGKLLLGLHHRYTTNTWGWEIVAGSVEPGEDLLKTAERELLEETGHQAERLKFIKTYNPAPGLGNETFHIYLAEGLNCVTDHIDADEIYELKEVAWEDVLIMISNGEITDGFSITALCLCQSLGLLEL